MKDSFPLHYSLRCLLGARTTRHNVPVYDDQGRLVHTNTCMKAPWG